MGRSIETKFSSYFIDSTGKLINTVVILMYEEYPYYDADVTRSDANLYYKARNFFIAPSRIAGQSVLLLDPINMYEDGRVAYQYLPGQRRVKLAPEMAFDNPNAATGGNSIYDEAWCFNGSLERFDWKIMGKREIYVPYNAYRTTYRVKCKELMGPKHLNPDLVRWELHRVWVVDAMLKPEQKHIYPNRRFYLDEDSWAILASDSYDDSGELCKVNFCFQIPNYEIPSPNSAFTASYNMISDNYVTHIWPGEDGYVRKTSVASERASTPAGIIRDSIR